MSSITTKIRTKHGLKEYTYLGCPLTRNRSPWCFRLCVPGQDGKGDCGRIAPHGLKSRIQQGIEDHQRRSQVHHDKLEHMYLSSPSNTPYEPGIAVSAASAEIVIAIRDEHRGPTGGVDHSLCLKALSDAALFAVHSVEQPVVMHPAAISVDVTGAFAATELVARGRFVGTSEDHYLAEAVLANAHGEEIARAHVAFIKTGEKLSPAHGYNA